MSEHDQHAPSQAPVVAPPYWYGAQDDNEIDLFELWDIVWSGKWLIIAVTALFAIISVAYALLATEIYEARVVMVPADSEAQGGLSSLVGQFGGLAALAGVSLGSAGGTSNEAQQVLQSFAFKSAYIGDKNLIPVLFEGVEVDPENPPSMQDAVQLFSGDVMRLSNDKKTGSLTLTIAWKDPYLAAQWANELVERINRHMRDQDVTEARKSIDFLNEKLKETGVVEMRDTIFRLIEAQTKTVMLANVRDEYAFKVIDPAYPPERRSSPKRTLIAVLGTFFGGVLGVLVVLARSLFRSYQSRKS